MARNEQDREDLLSEATALVERIEIVPAGQETPVVIGFRSNGAASIYFGGDPVYHFTSSGSLRRTFIDGLLYKSVNGSLVSLRRERTEQAVQLVRHELTSVEQSHALDALKNRLESLRQAISSQSFEMIGQVPDGADLIGRIEEWLAQLVNVGIAQSPGVS